ncbi:hypothetical protein KSX_54200 [Ktedonospora formicarum]|uniref:Uncharacterized protein n=1 Tax=Ktedonospora formicarum TaxID=2778364 RepID=A0A8J3I735_9CHLR|nr:hypothetical protein KSX_54200 [Ktedonospora formicarum]
MFMLSATFTEHMREFRAKRLLQISANQEIPVSINLQLRKLILHIVPFSAFALGERIDLRLT